jgi:hypothetical protein
MPELQRLENRQPSMPSMHQCGLSGVSGVSGASQCKSYPAANSDLTKENRLTMARLCLQAIGEISRVLDSNSLLRCHAPESYRTL